MSCQIFISYKRQGGDDLAFRLNERLKQSGYSDDDVFFDFDTLKKSTDFPSEIEENIKNCTDYVLVLSPGALDGCNNEKDWVRKEIALAIKYDKHIVPIMKHGFEFPEQMPEEIASIKNATALNFPTDYFEEAFQRLVIGYLNARLDISLEIEERIRQAAEKGDRVMINEFALREEMGTIKTAENPTKAFNDYISISKDLPAACYNIADIFDKCSTDPVMATKYNINTTDLSELTDFFGIPDFADDIEKETRLLELAKRCYAIAGDYAPALYRLGAICERNRDMEAAFDYYMKAAKQEYPPALNAVGYFYQYQLTEETLLSENPKKTAREYYKAAAKTNLSVAIYNLAKLNEENGDEEETVNAYKQALFGSPPVPQAAYALAKLYEKKNDIPRAKHYYQLSLEGGFFRAKKELDRLTQTRTSSR